MTTNSLNLGTLTEADFSGSPERGIVLTPPALNRYFAAYEKELSSPVAVRGEEVTFRQLFRRQAEGLARALMDGAPYQGFHFPC